MQTATKKTVEDFLPLIKASKGIYRNLSKTSIDFFRREYQYLLKHRTKTVGVMTADLVNKELSVEEYPYLTKLNAIKVIQRAINH